MAAEVLAPVAGPSSEPIHSITYLSSLSTEQDILQALEDLENAENGVEASLEQLLASTDRLEDPLDRIDSLRPLISSLTSEAFMLNEVVSERAEVADRISGKVRVLDLEQGRVKECIERVQAVNELKGAIGALYQAKEAKNWEEATRCTQRARSIDPIITNSQFAEAIVPTPNVPDPPGAALTQFTDSLTQTFLEAFTNAASARDEPTATRFFKLFPLLGPTAEAAGLAAYAAFVCTLVTPASTRRPAGAAAASSQALYQLTALLEQVALIVAQHQSVVEKHYGPGKMARVVAQLNTELDRQAIKVLDAWEEERRLSKTLAETRLYRFPQLSALHNPPPIPSIGPGGAAAVAAGAAASAAAAQLPASLRNLANVRAGAGTPSLGVGQPFGANPATATVVPPEDELPDFRAVDGLIGEVAAMSGKWQTYRRFLYSRLVEDEDEAEEQKPKPALNGTKTDEISDEALEALEMIEGSGLGRKVSGFLKDVYSPLEAWYLRVSLEKAHSSDEPDLSTKPLLSSALDDTFYMLKKVLTRISQTAHLPTFVALCDRTSELLQRDFADVLKKRLDGLVKDVGAAQSLRTEERERREKEARDGFIVYLNDLDTATEYVVRLVEEAEESEALDNAFFLDRELARAKVALEGVKKCEGHFRSISKVGLEQFFGQLIRPRLRPLITDCYKDVNYLLDEEAYAEAEFQDLVRKRFVRSWEALLEGYRDALTPNNFQQLFAAIVNFLVRPWETLIRQMRFTELGALRFDRDLRNVVTYLSSQTSFGAGMLRDSFARLQQIATLLQLEGEDDPEGFVAGSEISWRLSAKEIKAILAQRV